MRGHQTISRHGHASLDQVHVNLLAQLHAVRELLLVVCLSSLRLDVLLDSVDLRLVLDELLLDVIEHVVNGTLQNLVLLRIVLHLVISNLLFKTVSVNVEESVDQGKSLLLPFKLLSQLVSSGKLVLHFILHRLDLAGADLLLVVDSLVQLFHFVQIRLGLVFLDSESRGCRFSILQLTLLVLEVSLHLRHLGLSRQLVLSSHSLLHMLEQLRNHELAVLDFLLIVHLFSLELLGELVNLFLFLVEDFVLLFLTAASATILQVFLNLTNVRVVGFNHALHLEKLLLHLQQLAELNLT